MPYCHQHTKHSYKSVRSNAFFLDWQTQPRSYKRYPHFYPRFSLEGHEELEKLALIGCVTMTRQYPGMELQLRSVPSAGGLYPCEIYLQLRGIKGFIDGIYHFEYDTKNLCLLHEIEKDGVESFFPDTSKQRGIIALVSTVYFRSSWKYRDRALRYLFLDSGHQLGAIYSAMRCMDRESRLHFSFDKTALNERFGFRDDEMFTAALFASQDTQKPCEPMKVRLPYVCGCDYLESNDFIESSYREGAAFDDTPLPLQNFFTQTPASSLEDAIFKRRSIRAFSGKSITRKEFEKLCAGIFEFASSQDIQIYYTLHRVEDMGLGLYCNGNLEKTGEFSKTSRYLGLEQALGGDSAVTFYFTSKEEYRYQKVSMLSGFIAQLLYLKAQLLGLGCSGIGAYYDDEVKGFLQTPNNILYMLAVGR